MAFLPSGSFALCVLSAVALSALALGCGEGDKTISGTATPTFPGGAGGAAGAAGAFATAGSGGAAGGGGASSGKKVREVFQRNPFGDVSSENTLWDGDFEWAGGFASQYPWLSFSSFDAGFEPPDVKVSGQCRSGLKCGTLTGDRSAAGIAASPKTALTRVRAYGKPGPGERCDTIVVSYDLCFDSGAPRDIGALTEMPTATERGYCVYEADVPTFEATPCVFLSYDGEADSVFIDNVFVGAPPEGQKPMALHLAGPPSAARLARLERGHAALRAFRDRPPPPPVTPRLVLPTRRTAK